MAVFVKWMPDRVKWVPVFFKWMPVFAKWMPVIVKWNVFSGFGGFQGWLAAVYAGVARLQFLWGGTGVLLRVESTGF